MIELMMWLAWLLPALAVYRRVGYAIEPKSKGHFPRGHILGCWACNCRKCGESYSNHTRWRGISNVCSGDFVPNRIPHPRTVLAFPLVYFTWPLILLGYGFNRVATHYGLTRGQFFVPPPEVVSKEEKQKRRLAELEAQTARSEAEVARLGQRLKELGVEV